MEKEYEDVEIEFWKFEKEGDFVAGVYLSKQSDVGANKSLVYNLEQPTGKIISVWGSTVLDTKMNLIKFGDDIKIIYLGKKKGESIGKRKYHDFKIQKAKSEDNEEGGED